MRIAFNIALIVSILYLPWWVGAVLLAAGCFVVGQFYEALVYGIVFDALYGTRFVTETFAYAGSLFALIVFSASALLRDKLSW